MSGISFGDSSELGLSQLGNLGSPMRVDWFHTGAPMDVDMTSGVSREAKGANHISSSSGTGVKDACLSNVAASTNVDRSKPSTSSAHRQERSLIQSQYCLTSPQRISLRAASGTLTSPDSIILPVVSLRASEESRIFFDMAIRLL